ncbi:MAG TPA: hypothetical protein VMS49_04010 [Lysobacter sp.]|jgi:hypothetical protein|nr:hypothetical protein [Lysobacter sp.]
MQHALRSVVLVTTLALSFGVGATHPGRSLDTGMQHALLGHVASQHELSSALAPVRNVGQFQAYLRDHRGPSSPFHAMSPAALERFSRSLVFNENGLASYAYADLRRELSASQIYAALRVFGAEASVSSIPGLKGRNRADKLVLEARWAVPSGHHDMYCAGLGSCAPRLDWVCTMNC